MRNIIYIYSLCLMIIASSCVDDYQDANPPRLLDAPAVNSVEIQDEVLAGGASTLITIAVVDAPGGLVDIIATDVDQFGVAIGGTFDIVNSIAGLTQGVVEVEYTAPTGFAGTATLSVAVKDGQLDDEGGDASKNSVAQTLTVEILCGEFAGVRQFNGELLVDDFASGPYSYMDNVSLVDCAEEGVYSIADISGGLYANSYAENYGTSARAAVITIDDSSNEVTWTGVSDQFGGEIIQDPAQPVSNYNPSSGIVTIFWTATAFGERGITTIDFN